MDGFRRVGRKSPFPRVVRPGRLRIFTRETGFAVISLRWSPSVALLFGLLVLGEWPLVRAAEPAAAGLPVEPVATHALVAGFERFFESPAGGKFPAEAAAGKPLSAVDLAAGGRLLLGELSCLSCHAAEGSQAEWIVPKTAPKLSQAGGRIKVAAFKRMLANPHGAKPGTTMPNVLAALPEPERAEATEALLHLLASTGAVVESAPARTAVTEGEALFHSLERVAVIAEQHNGVVKLQASAKALTLSAEAETNSGVESVPCTGKLPAMAANARYLIDGLRSLDGETITISANEATTPVVLTGTTGQTYLVMPVQIRQ